MKKTALILLMVLPLWAQPVSMEPIVLGVNHYVSRAARSGANADFAEALVQIQKGLRALERDSTLSPRMRAEKIEYLRFLHFWSGEMIRVNDRALPTLPGPDDDKPVEMTVTEPESPEASIPAAAPKDDFGPVKGVLTKVMYEYATGNEAAGNGLMVVAFREIEGGLGSRLAGPAREYTALIESITARFMKKIAAMRGRTVVYRTPGSPKYFRGMIVDVSGTTVHLASEATQMGIPVYALDQTVLKRTAELFNRQERAMLAAYMYFHGAAAVGRLMYTEKDDDTSIGLFVKTIRRVLAAAEQDRLVERGFAAVLHADRKFGAGDYSAAVLTLMKLMPLADEVLGTLDRRYRQERLQGLHDLMELAMTTCQTCHGKYKEKCTKCKGTGKVIEDTIDTFFMADKTTLRFVKCPDCAGDGMLYCAQCTKRRFYDEGLELKKRLASILPGAPDEGDNQ